MGKKNPFVFTIGFDKSDPDLSLIHISGFGCHAKCPYANLWRDARSAGICRPAAVSYTHLDVYKRQKQGSMRMSQGMNFDSVDTS